MPYDLKQLLIQRLSHRGLEKNQIPGFLRSLANSIDIDKNPNYTIMKLPAASGRGIKTD